MAVGEDEIFSSEFANPLIMCGCGCAYRSEGREDRGPPEDGMRRLGGEPTKIMWYK